MPDFKYVVIGGGMTGHAAAQGIRSADASGSIVLLGEEPVGPYARPPLTKGLWTGQEEGAIWLPAVGGVSGRTGARVAGDGVVYYRTVADYRCGRALPGGKHVAVVGGGFIGSEIAASLATAGYRVTLLFPEEGIGARLF